VWQIAWGVLWGFLQDVWARVGRPIFQAFMDIVDTVWRLIGPIFELMGMAFAYLVNWMMEAWKYVGKPLFDAFIWIVKFLWTNVIDPVLGFIVDAWERLWALVELAWTSIGKPIFELVIAVVESLVEIFKGNFDKLGEIWDTFWESLKVAAAKPVNFVIHFVLNKGLFKAFNWVIDTLNLPKDWRLGDVGQVGPQAARYATGGRVAGWSPHDKADNVPAMLTAGEYVHPVASTRYYGTDIM
jgi:hypothetical protein